MNINFTLFLSRKGQLDGRKEICLLGESMMHGVRYKKRASTGIFILPENFFPDLKNKAQRCKGAVMIKKRISSPEVKVDRAAKAELDKLLVQLQHNFEEVDIDRAVNNTDHLQEMIDAVNGKVKDSNDFFTLALHYVSQKRESTRGTYITTLRCMERYELFLNDKDIKRDKVNNITNKGFRWSTHATPDDIDGWFDYMRNEGDLAKLFPKTFERMFVSQRPELATVHIKNKRIENKSDNGINSREKQVRAIWHWMIKQGKAEKSPFTQPLTKASYADPFYLTKEERDQVDHYDFNDKLLNLERDIFVFQCLTGCRYSDLCVLTQDNIKGEFLDYIPLKTSREENPAHARVPLARRAMELINAHKGEDPKYLFPTVATQNYSTHIRTMLTQAGINRKIAWRDHKTGDIIQRPICEVASSHIARRTFVGACYKKVKDIRLIATMSGHSPNSKAISRYYTPDDDDRKKLIAMIE